MDDVEKIARELTEARRKAIKGADRSGVAPVVATILVFSGINLAFGDAASFWAAGGALASCVVFLWEAGRNSMIEDAAMAEWVRAYLQEQDDA